MVLWNQYISCHEKEGLTLSWYFHAKTVSLASFSARRWPAPDHTTTSCKTTRRPTSFSRTISMCVIASENCHLHHDVHSMRTERGGRGGPTKHSISPKKPCITSTAFPYKRKSLSPSPSNPFIPIAFRTLPPENPWIVAIQLC